MTNNKRRRDFLKTTLKGTLALTVGGSTMSSFIEPYSSLKTTLPSPYETGFDQQPLPYAYNALEECD